MLANGTLESITAEVLARGINPQPVSGRQERLENLWNRYL
jgi:xylose isomerase